MKNLIKKHITLGNASNEKMKIKELFSNESKWCQRCYARDKNGLRAYPRSNKAVCWCLLGAIKKCYLENDFNTIKIMIKTKIKISSNDSVALWNDDPKRTFKEVKQLVEELDI